MQPLPPTRIEGAKRSFTTRRVSFDGHETLVAGAVRPRSGDLALARVERIGQHGKLETPQGRRSWLHVGDEIIVTYGDRYATDQFEAQVPNSLAPTQLVASGGIASQMLSRNRGVRRATDIVPVGLIGDERGVVMNLRDFALPPCSMPERRPPTVVVLGTAMNSGKTTTARHLVHALARLGYRVGATKVTGTGSGGDYWVMKDAGAHAMVDFTDAGFSSTYRIDMNTVERSSIGLIAHLASLGCDAIVAEVADGLFQHETSHLLTSPAFRDCVDGYVFSAADALGAIGGYERLRSLQLNVLGIAGRLTRSPLAMRETARTCTVPVFTLDDLSEPDIALSLFGLPPQEPPVPASAGALVPMRPPAEVGELAGLVHPVHEVESWPSR